MTKPRKPHVAVSPKTAKTATPTPVSRQLSGSAPSPAALSAPPPAAPRRHRARPTPSWLLEHQDHDEIARRRLLLVLSVVSGETPVTDAIAGTDISRQMYYQLEERALKAMLKALTPGSEATPILGPDPAAQRRIAELEAKVKQLEQDKRRTDRLLYVTRKVVSAGPLKTGCRGRPPKAAAKPASEDAGARLSPTSKPRALARTTSWAALARPPEAGTDASTPTPAGVDEPSAGTES